MNGKLLLWVVVLVLLSVSVSAVVNDALVYVSMDGNNVSGTNINNQGSASYNYTGENTPIINSSYGYWNEGFLANAGSSMLTLDNATVDNAWGDLQEFSFGGYVQRVTTSDYVGYIYNAWGTLEPDRKWRFWTYQYYACSVTKEGNGEVLAQWFMPNTDTDWHHVACTTNGTNIMIYGDGVLKNTSVHFTEGIVNSNEYNRIGDRSSSTSKDFEGNVDEVFFYDRMLSSAEVLNISTENPYEETAAAPTNDTPVPVLDYPNDNTNFYDQKWMNFSCAYTGDDASATLNLYLNGTLNQTNASALNNTKWQFNVSIPAYANYSAVCEADDGNSKANTSAISFALLETNTAPVSTVIIPLNASYPSRTWIVFHLKGVDEQETALTGYLWLDGVLNATNASVINNTKWMPNISGLSSGEHTAIYEVCDSFVCSNSTSKVFNTTNSTPVPALEAPADNANFINRTWMVFSSSFTDNDDAGATLNLYLNGTLNQTNASALNNTAWVVNVSLPYANYSVIIEVDDGNTKANTSEITFALIEDTTPAPPVYALRLYLPMNHSGTTCPVDYAPDSDDNSLDCGAGTFTNLATYVTGLDSRNALGLDGSGSNPEGFNTNTDTGLTLKSGDDWTVMASLTPNASGANIYLLRQGTDEWAIYRHATSLRYEHQLNGNFCTNSGSYVHATDTTAHLAWSYDNTANEIYEYVNGTLTTTIACTNEAIFTNGNLRMFMRDYGNYWSGTVQDVRIYFNSSLNASLINSTFYSDTAYAPSTAINKSDLIAGYSFDQHGFDHAHDNHLELFGGATYSSSILTGGNGSLYVQGTDDYSLNSSINNINLDNFSLVFNMRRNVTTQYLRSLTYYVNATNYFMVVHEDASNRDLCFVGKFGNATEYGNCTENGDLNIDTWKNFIITVENKKIHIYINNTQSTNVALTDGWGVGTNTGLYVGIRNDLGGDFTGYIDELMIVNKSLSESERNFVYAGGTTKTVTEVAGAYVPPDSNSTPAPVLDYPNDNDNFINQTWMNFSCAYTGDDASAILNLYLNGTLNQTNASALNATKWQFNVTLPYANYSAICEADDGNNKANTSAITFALVNGTTLPSTDANPTSTISYPINSASLTNRSWINVSILGVDDDNSSMVAYLFVNGTLNATNSSLLNNTLWNYNLSGLGITSYSLIAEVCDALNCTNSSTITFSNELPVTPSGDLVLHLSFDSLTDCGNDDAGVHTDFSAIGAANCVESSTYCKWYGCANFTATSGDYYAGLAQFNMSLDFTVSFWLYPTSEPTGSNSQMFYEMGVNGNDGYQRVQEGDYGLSINYDAATGSPSVNAGESDGSGAGSYIHWCTEYDGSRIVMYRNGAVVSNSSQPYGQLKYTFGYPFNVGVGTYGIDTVGYMDEFKVWNGTGNCIDEFNRVSAGTPPVLDLWVQNVSYVMPWNWSSPTNKLMTNQTLLPITFTIKNQGTNDSGLFDYGVYVDGVLNYSSETSLLANSTKVFVFNWTIVYETFPFVELRLDVNRNISEDEDANNNYSFYVPFKNHPWNIVWNSSSSDYCYNSSNLVGYSSCDVVDSFVSDDFNYGWGVDNVDPRGRKGLENAMGCYLNGFPASSAQCERATRHVRGWANLTGWASGDNQAIHELIWVGQTFDIMFQNMTQADAEWAADRYRDICNDVVNKNGLNSDTYPRQITGDNGQGFGTGIYAVCDYVLGMDSKNPTNMNKPTLGYWGRSNNDLAYNRLDGYLKSYGNDSDAKYSERMLYKMYSQTKAVPVSYFAARHGMYNYDTYYNNTFCAMGVELITDILDNRYSGGTLRGDEWRNWRVITAGDTNSYEDIGSDTFLNWGIITYYGLMCDNQTVKNALFTLRNLGHASGEEQYSHPEAFMFYEFEAQVNDTGYELYDFRKAFFDDVNDIVTWRDNYTYSFDTMVQIDGGQHHWEGHPNSEGYFFYYKGYPFLDYTQVPYNDNVRAEMWNNAVSFLNASDSYAYPYAAICGFAPANQHYADQYCDAIGAYPDFTWLTFNESGDVVDVYGASDASVGSALNIIPMSGASKPIREYFFKMGDSLLRYVVVVESDSGKILDNNLNLDTDIDVLSSNSENITFQAFDNTTYMSVNLIYSNESATLHVDENVIQYGFTKTNSPTGLGYYRRTYLQFDDEDASWIRAYVGYESSVPSIISLSSDGDEAVQIGSDTAVFDTDGSGVVKLGDYTTDGWGLIMHNTSGYLLAPNATYIKNNGTTIVLSILATELYVEFNATIANDTTAPVLSNPFNMSTNETATLGVTANELVTCVFEYGVTVNMGSTMNDTVLGLGCSVELSGLISNTTYFWNVTATDVNTNAAELGVHTFSTEVTETPLSWEQRYNAIDVEYNNRGGFLHWDFTDAWYTNEPTKLMADMDMYEATGNLTYLATVNTHLSNYTGEYPWFASPLFTEGHFIGVASRFVYLANHSNDSLYENRSIAMLGFLEDNMSANYSALYFEFEHNNHLIAVMTENAGTRAAPINQQIYFIMSRPFLYNVTGNETYAEQGKRLTRGLTETFVSSACASGVGVCHSNPYRYWYGESWETSIDGATWGLAPYSEQLHYATQEQEAYYHLWKHGLLNQSIFDEIALSISDNMFASDAGYSNTLASRSWTGAITSYEDFHGWGLTHQMFNAKLYSVSKSNISLYTGAVLNFTYDWASFGNGSYQFFDAGGYPYASVTDPISGVVATYVQEADKNKQTPDQLMKMIATHLLSNATLGANIDFFDDPVLSNDVIPLTTTNDVASSVRVDCVEVAVDAGFPKVSFIDPNGLTVGNLSMSLVSGDTYTRAYTFNIVGTYYDFKFYCADPIGASDSLAGSNNITVSIGAGTGGGGGGGDPEPVTDKRDCDIVVSPSTLSVTRNNKIFKVTLANEDVVTYEPSIALEDSFGDVVVRSASGVGLYVTNPAFTSIPSQVVSFGVAYDSPDVNISGGASLILSSDVCNDIIVPVVVDIVQERSLLEEFIDGDITFDELLETPIATVAQRDVTVLLVGLLLVILSLLAFGRPLSESFRERRFGSVVGWFLFSLFVAGLALALFLLGRGWFS